MHVKFGIYEFEIPR